MYYFKTEKLTVGYDGVPVIFDIEIGIDKGETLVLIGPNGAGKSTVLKSISGQLSLISGSIYLDNKDFLMMDPNDKAKKSGVLFTDRVKSDMLSCFDVVSSGRYPYTGYLGILKEEDKNAVNETMELVGITDLRDRDFSKISDGQKQRVMLARALCREPEILILDEPTSFLDIRYKLEFLYVLDIMKKKKNITVIMSVHELDIAKKIADKVLSLKGDKADRFGTPAEIFTEDYIARLYDIDERIGLFAESKGINIG